MQTGIKKVKNKAITLIKLRKMGLNKLVKPKNPNLYYKNLNIKSYYFC